jgi:precorrin-4/cobalt-precorrin-4 C11-methyltransferase
VIENRTVYFVGAGPGDPELITIKAKKILQQADVVIYSGSLLNPTILK